MSFRFNWPEFDQEFITLASVELENALNRGKKPSNICDTIRVKELNMGTQPPELDILEIGELTMDRFRGIFKMAYSGDGYLVLETKVQANPLNFANFTANGEQVVGDSGPISPFQPTAPSILAADLPLIVPMQLKISQMKLRAILVLIVSRAKGITLSFKTDPLESVLVSSTFDSVPSVRRHLQSEIENRLRDLLQKELPALVHTVSTDWLRRNGVQVHGEDFREPFVPEQFVFERPHPRKAGSPSSLTDLPFAGTPWTTAKSPSITAQSAPVELASASPQRSPSSKSSEEQGLFETMSVVTAPEQHYFSTHSNIIVRAPTEQALPDPALLDRSKMFQKRTSSLSKAFKSLFRIPEAIATSKEVDDLEEEGVGLKAIDSIGMGLTTNSGVCSVRSLVDHVNMSRAFSTVSGHRYSRQFAFDRYSEADPDLVQFEPDEFRSDWTNTSNSTKTKSTSAAVLSPKSSDGTRSLATKLNIMRRLQSTLAPNTFEESNVIYRTKQ